MCIWELRRTELYIYKRLKVTQNRMAGDKTYCYKKESKKCSINNGQKWNSKPKVREYFI